MIAWELSEAGHVDSVPSIRLHGVNKLLSLTGTGDKGHIATCLEYYYGDMYDGK